MYFLVLFRVDLILNRLFNVFMDMICQHYYKTVCIISVSSRNKAFVMNVMTLMTQGQWCFMLKFQSLWNDKEPKCIPFKNDTYCKTQLMPASGNDWKNYKAWEKTKLICKRTPTSVTLKTHLMKIIIMNASYQCTAWESVINACMLCQINDKSSTVYPKAVFV